MLCNSRLSGSFYVLSDQKQIGTITSDLRSKLKIYFNVGFSELTDFCFTHGRGRPRKYIRAVILRLFIILVDGY